jgi:hypothetical protein
MPALKFSDISSQLLEPAISWRFYCTLPTVDEGADDLNGQFLSFLVERVQLPIVGVAFEPSPYNAGERKFPAARTLDVVGISFIETSKYQVLNYMWAWKRLVVQENGNFGMPANYKKPIQLDAFNQQGIRTRSFRYPYCAPSRIDNLEFDGSGTKAITVNVVFEVDNVFRGPVSNVSVD